MSLKGQKIICLVKVFLVGFVLGFYCFIKIQLSIPKVGTKIVLFDICNCFLFCFFGYLWQQSLSISNSARLGEGRIASVPVTLYKVGFIQNLK